MPPKHWLCFTYVSPASAVWQCQCWQRLPPVYLYSFGTALRPMPMLPKHWLCFTYVFRPVMYDNDNAAKGFSPFTCTALAQPLGQGHQSIGCLLGMCLPPLLYDSANAANPFPLFYLYNFDRAFRPMSPKHWTAFYLLVCVSGEPCTSVPMPPKLSPLFLLIQLWQTPLGQCCQSMPVPPKHFLSFTYVSPSKWWMTVPMLPKLSPKHWLCFTYRYRSPASAVWQCQYWQRFPPFTYTALAQPLGQCQCRQSIGCLLGMCLRPMLYDSANKCHQTFPPVLLVQLWHTL